MDKQPTGNFVAFINRDKQPGDKRPMFQGRLAQPGQESEHPFTLWAHEFTDSKTGEVKTMFNGEAGALALNAEAADQVNALMRAAPSIDGTIGNLKLAPRQLVLFPNRFKSDAPEKKRPDYWGAYNPGDGTPVVRVSAWMAKDRYQNAMLRGATSYPVPGKSEAQMQDGLAVIESSTIPAKSRKSRAASPDEPGRE